METKLAVFLVDGEEYGLDIANINTVEKDFNIEYLPIHLKMLKVRFIYGAMKYLFTVLEVSLVFLRRSGIKTQDY